MILFKKIRWESFSFTITAETKSSIKENKIKQFSRNFKELYHHPKNSGLTGRCFLCVKAADKKWSTVSRSKSYLLLMCWPGILRLELKNGERKFLIVSYPAITYWQRKRCITKVCIANFGLKIPSENRRGSTTNQILMGSFKRVCDCLEDEADSELYTWVKFITKWRS